MLVEFNINHNGLSGARRLKHVSKYLTSLLSLWGLLLGQQQYVLQVQGVTLQLIFFSAAFGASLPTGSDHRLTVSLSGRLQGSDTPPSSLTGWHSDV